MVLPTVSNFELIDALILHVADRFPSLRAVVQVGHSAGGQLVSRHAVGTTVHDQLRERGIHMRSIIANPSSFPYLGRQRPNLAAESGFIGYDEGVPLVAEGPCPTFNNYLYGMDDLAPYMGHRLIPDMVAAFRRRDIWVFNGMEDNKVSPDMDTSCPASLQGGNRLERGRRYYEYLGHFFGRDVYNSKFIELVPGVGHDAWRMYTSDQGKAVIFINADSAAAALSDGSDLDSGRWPEGGRWLPGLVPSSGSLASHHTPYLPSHRPAAGAALRVIAFASLRQRSKRSNRHATPASEGLGGDENRYGRSGDRALHGSSSPGCL